MRAFKNKQIMVDFTKQKEIAEVLAKLKKLRENYTTINHVYQESYIENHHVTGFGDFIRGSYFLLEFCNKYGLKPEITINHPIALSLKGQGQGQDHPLKKIPFIPFFAETNTQHVHIDNHNYITGYETDKNNINHFIRYLYHCEKMQSTPTSTTTPTQTLNTYNIMLPYEHENISEENKKYIRERIEPSEQLKLYIDQTLGELSLEKKQYSVIHIRCGDTYLINKYTYFDNVFLNTMRYQIGRLMGNKQQPFLLIADNNEIKKKISTIFPQIKVFYRNITHLGEGLLLEKDKVENTLLDFFLLSHAKSIHAYTTHEHGSGFSYWCAKTYDIPYKCMRISLY